MEKVSINEFNTLFSSFIKNKKFSTHKQLLSILSDLCKKKAKISIYEKQSICLSCNIFIENNEKYPIHCDCNIHIKCFDNYIKKKTSKKFEASKEFQIIICEICERNIKLSNLNLKKSQDFKKEVKKICLICLSECNINEGIILNCSHFYCKLCISEYIMQQYKNQLKIDFKCPISECIENISFENCKFCLSESQFEIIENKILIQNIDSYIDLDEKIARCPNSDCNYFLILSIEDDAKSVYCPQCNEEYCVNGCANLHNNMTCREYEKIYSQEDNNFKNYIKQNKVKLCGKCKKWVEKSKGCNHMVCLCKYEFCYICGEKWKNCDCNQFTHDSEEENSILSNQRFGMRRRNILYESSGSNLTRKQSMSSKSNLTRKRSMTSKSSEDLPNFQMHDNDEIENSKTFDQPKIYKFTYSDNSSPKTLYKRKKASFFNDEESKSSESKISIDDSVSSSIKRKKSKKKFEIILKDSFSLEFQSFIPIENNFEFLNDSLR